MSAPLRDPRLMSDSELLLEAQRLLELDTARRYRWECDRPVCDGEPHEGYGQHARTEQREPTIEYRTWLIMSGRGWGKTRTGAETCKKWGLQRRRHIAVIAKSHREVQNICFEAAKAGLLAVIPPDQQLVYNKSSGSVKLTLTNGTILRAFSAEDPDAIRGYAFDDAWCDEYAAWPKQTAQDMLDQLWFCLRESPDPHVIITTTPQPHAHVKKIIEETKTESTAVLTRGHTLDNLKNLSKSAVDVLMRRYDGNRLGRQELAGELLEDVEGALLTQDLIDAGRRALVDVPVLVSKVTAVDPAVTSTATSDETGIVTVGVDQFTEVYVEADRSGVYRPDEWGRLVWQEVKTAGSQAVVIEDNQGGDMCEHVLMSTWSLMEKEERAAGRSLGPMPPIVRVHPSGAGQGKWARALPVAALYDNGRVHHVLDVDDNTGRNDLALLEEQLTTWTNAKDDNSPDRIDALVHGVSYLVFPARRAEKKAKKQPAKVPVQNRWAAGRRR